MKRRPRCYLSGPMSSSGDMRQNVENGMAEARWLMRNGFAVLCPHLTWYLDQKGEHFTHADWMENDIPWVRVADVVRRIPGPSSGAEQECREAFERGIEIFHTREEILEWKKRWQGNSR